MPENTARSVDGADHMEAQKRHTRNGLKADPDDGKAVVMALGIPPSKAPEESAVDMLDGVRAVAGLASRQNTHAGGIIGYGQVIQSP